MLHNKMAAARKQTRTDDAIVKQSIEPPNLMSASYSWTFVKPENRTMVRFGVIRRMLGQLITLIDPAQWEDKLLNKAES